jgi:hypothetical protein
MGTHHAGSDGRGASVRIEEPTICGRGKEGKLRGIRTKEEKGGKWLGEGEGPKEKRKGERRSLE